LPYRPKSLLYVAKDLGSVAASCFLRNLSSWVDNILKTHSLYWDLKVLRHTESFDRPAFIFFRAGSSIKAVNFKRINALKT
jgi:hypothetical protein